MSKISEQAARKFAIEESFKLGNTQVMNTCLGMTMSLHGNLIAHYDEDTLILFTRGWLTRTTKDRLNCILSQWGLGIISQKKGKWYYKDYRTETEMPFMSMLTFDKSRTPEGYIKHLFNPQASY